MTIQSYLASKMSTILRCIIQVFRTTIACKCIENIKVLGFKKDLKEKKLSMAHKQTNTHIYMKFLTNLPDEQTE